MEELEESESVCSGFHGDCEETRGTEEAFFDELNNVDGFAGLVTDGYVPIETLTDLSNYSGKIIVLCRRKRDLVDLEWKIPEIFKKYHIGKEIECELYS